MSNVDYKQVLVDLIDKQELCDNIVDELFSDLKWMNDEILQNSMANQIRKMVEENHPGFKDMLIQKIVEAYLEKEIFNSLLEELDERLSKTIKPMIEEAIKGKLTNLFTN